MPAWRSLDSALVSEARGHRFKSDRGHNGRMEIHRRPDGSGAVSLDDGTFFILDPDDFSFAPYVRRFPLTDDLAWLDGIVSPDMTGVEHFTWPE